MPKELHFKKGDNVCTNDVDQANLLNAQFQSFFFSIRAPLDLMKLCHTTMLNGANSLVKNMLSSIVKRYMRDLVKTYFGLLKIQVKF